MLALWGHDRLNCEECKPELNLELGREQAVVSTTSSNLVPLILTLRNEPALTYIIVRAYFSSPTRTTYQYKQIAVSNTVVSANSHGQDTRILQKA